MFPGPIALDATLRCAAGPTSDPPLTLSRLLSSVEPTIASRGNLSCGYLLIGRVTYRGQVVPAIPGHQPNIDSFFPRASLSSIHVSFASINSLR